MTRKHLLDLNVLIALADSGHSHFQRAHQWLDREGWRGWAICPLTESGFVRLAINPAFAAGSYSVHEAVALLDSIKSYSGYQYWTINKSWVELTAPFADRITGHRQVTDAYLLGLAIDCGGVLVTFDKGMRLLAGEQFHANLCVLQ